MRFLIGLFLLFTSHFVLYSQEVKVIKNAVGEYIVSNKSEISLKAAFEKAVVEAKLNALRMAGVVENISSSDILTSSDKSSNVKQDINSILSVQISGAVFNDSVISEKTSVDQFGNTVIRVVLNANVIKYTQKYDQSFDFKIEGIKEFYENNDLMAFTFLPYSDGYLTIFSTNENENFILFPYLEEGNHLLNDSINIKFRANKKYTFPLNKLIGNPQTHEVGYLLSTEMERENNCLIFVYTKEIFPFVKRVTYKNIIECIYTISPDKRKIQYHDFVIIK